MSGTIWCSKAAMNVVPELPYPVWVTLFALLFTGMNLRGIKASARTNEVLTVAMSAVVVVFVIAALRYIFSTHPTQADLTRPFYDPATFSLPSVLTGASIAVLTYIGFDGISTLSEEVENPRRNILLATVLSCLAIGILAAVEVYLAQLIWPASQPYPSVETAFAHAAGRAAPWMLMMIMVTLMVANGGSGTGALLGAARLLYGMGRSGALPPKFF